MTIKKNRLRWALGLTATAGALALAASAGAGPWGSALPDPTLRDPINAIQTGDAKRLPDQLQVQDGDTLTIWFNSGFRSVKLHNTRYRTTDGAEIDVSDSMPADVLAQLGPRDPKCDNVRPTPEQAKAQQALDAANRPVGSKGPPVQLPAP